MSAMLDCEECRGTGLVDGDGDDQVECRWCRPCGACCGEAERCERCRGDEEPW